MDHSASNTLPLIRSFRRTWLSALTWVGVALSGSLLAQTARLPNPAPNLPENPALRPAVITPEGERVLLEAAPGIEVRYRPETNDVEVTPAGHWLINYPLESILDAPPGGVPALAEELFGRSAGELRNWYFKTPGEPEWIVPAQTGPAPISNTPNPTLVVNNRAINASDASVQPGTIASPLRTISEAVRRAGPGTIIHVYPGIYREKVEVSVSGTESSPIRIEGVRGENGEMPVISGNDLFPPNSWVPQSEWPGVYRAPLFNNVLGTVSNGGTWLIERDLPSELGENEVALSRSSPAFLDTSAQAELVPVEGTQQLGATWQRVSTDSQGFINFGDVYGAQAAGEAIIWMSTWIWVEPGDRDSLDPNAPVPVAGEAYVAEGFRAGRIVGGLMHVQRNQYRIWVGGERVPVMRYFSDLNQQLHREPVSSRDYGFGDMWNAFPLAEGWNHVVFQVDTSYRPDLLNFRIRAGRGMPNWIATANRPEDLTRPPTTGISNQYIDEYMVLGPFPTGGTERAVYVRLAGDADPNEAEMDLAARRNHMVDLQGDFIHFRGFEVQHGAHYQQTAMVQVAGKGSLLEGCLVRDGEVRGLGVYLRNMDQNDPPIVVRNNWVMNMGNLGVGATGGTAFLNENNLNDPIPGRGRVILEHNHIENANWAGYVAMDESGGMKVFRLSGSHIRYNTFKGGHGPAIWLDWEHYNNRIEGNRVIDGYALAVGVEASPGPHLVANNVSVNLRPGPAWFRSGVLTWSSDRTLIMHNTIDGRRNPLPAWQGRTGAGGISTVEGNDDRGTRFVPLQNRRQTIANNLLIGVDHGVQSRSNDVLERNARDTGTADWLPEEWPVFPRGDVGDYRIPADNSLNLSGTSAHGVEIVRQDFFGLLRFDEDGRSIGAFRAERPSLAQGRGLVEAEFQNGDRVRFYETAEIVVEGPTVNPPFEYNFGTNPGRNDWADFGLFNLSSWSLQEDAARVSKGASSSATALATLRLGPVFPGNSFVLRTEMTPRELKAGANGSGAGLILFGATAVDDFNPQDAEGFYSLMWQPNDGAGGNLALRRGMDGVEVARVDFANLPNPPAGPSADDPEAGLNVRYILELRGTAASGGGIDFTATLSDRNGRNATVSGTIPGPFGGKTRVGFGVRHAAADQSTWDFHRFSLHREIFPLLHYAFNQSGGLNNASTPNSGTRPSSDLTMQNGAGTAANLLGPDGSGVSGRAGTRSLDFSSAASMGGSGPIGVGAQPLSTATPYRSYTLTGWFRTAGQTPLTGVARLWDLGGGNLQVLGSDGAINVQMNNGVSFVSPPVYDATQEWVFYSIVFNGPERRLDFYVGGVDQPVQHAGALTLNFEQVALSRLVVGNRSSDRARAFHGRLDDKRFYADPVDSSAALILSELERIRLDALREEKPNTFEAWRRSHFQGAALQDPAVSGPMADPAGDQVPNLLKYAFDLSPSESFTLGDLVASEIVDGQLVLTFYERTDVEDLIYIPQASSDLRVWMSGPEAIEEIGREPAAANLVRVTVRLRVEAAAAGFLRLRVRQN